MKKIILTSILIWILLSMIGPSNVSAQKEKVVVDFLGSQYGTYSFIIMYAASDVVNKNHPWIKGLVRETFGASDCIKHLDADPKLRKHAIATCTIPAMYGGRAGRPKEIYPRPIKGILNLFNEVDAAWQLVTTDPKIKTPADLVGRRADVGAYGNYMGVIGDILLEAYGVKDKLASLEHAAQERTAIGNLIDGKIDVSTSGMLKMPGDKCGFSALTKELMAARKVYPLSVSPEMIKKMVEISGIPFSSWTVPAGAFSPDAPSFTTVVYPLNAVAHEDMPEQLVYEIMKVLIAHVTELKKYSAVAGWMTKENMASMHLPVADFHPGAIKAYREAGIKIGEEYFK